MEEQKLLDFDGMLGELKKMSEFFRTAPGIKKLRDEVASRLGSAPRELLYQEHSLSVYRYKQTCPPRLQTPILLVYSLVNRSYIMDLLERESFVRALIERGATVYMVDWGDPNPAQKDLSLGYYIRHYLGRAIRRVCNDAGSPGLTLAGYCLGGNLALLAAAVDKGRLVKNLITMVTPVNFHDEGLLSWWSKDEHFNVDKIVDSFGNIPAEFFARSFPWLVPTASIKKARAVYENQKDRPFLESLLALDIWGNDNTAFPGQVYRELMKTGYQENTLVKNKAWRLDDEDVAMADVTMPVLNLAAQYDHISPASSCMRLAEMVGSKDCTEQVLPTGHLGIALGKDALNQHTPAYWNDIAAWLGERD